jgi:hypothetical protein
VSERTENAAETPATLTNRVPTNPVPLIVNWNNYCFFVNDLTEFSEGLQTEEDWKIDYKVEI